MVNGAINAKINKYAKSEVKNKKSEVKIKYKHSKRSRKKCERLNLK
jgi:hypothetical protein